MPSDPILTVAEVAMDLRCSKSHVCKAINGAVAGVTPLPAITMGRRKLIRRSALEAWKSANEGRDGKLNLSLEVNAGDASRRN